MSLLDGEIACVDLETTGGHPLYHRVLEVGITVLKRGEVVERWSSLVHPGTRIPAGIVAFTGITDEMVADAPPFERVAAEVLARLHGRMFAAHNARFDYGFLRTEFRRLGKPLRLPVLCTVKLSRRLYPDSPRHNLDTVMARHGIACNARHRALGDADVVAEFLRIVRHEHPPANVDAVVAELTRGAVLPPQLDPDLIEELPESPGVYRFYGADGVLLYVGKSRNLRHRVLEHFAAADRDSKEQRLARQVQRLDWVETAGELGALLKESHWVKTLAPLHNRRLKPADELWTIRLDAVGDSVEASVVPLSDIDAEAYGTFRRKAEATRALTGLVREHQLCARSLRLEPGSGPCFGHQVGRCRGVCAGKESPGLHAARVRLALAGLKLRSWPFRGPIALVERDWRGLEEQHVFDAWRYVGTASPDRGLDDVLGSPPQPFDLDAYRLLSRWLERPDPRIEVRELPPRPAGTRVVLDDEADAPAMTPQRRRKRQ